MSIKAIIYARVSSKEQAKDGRYGLEYQVSDCLKWAEANDFEIVDIIREAQSGKDFERPRFDELKSRVEARRKNFEAIIVWKQDRFSRADVHETLGLIAYFAKHKVDIFSIDTGILDESNIVTIISSWAAKQEREKILERTSQGKIKRLESGKVNPNGGIAPYGYDYNKEAGMYEPNEQEAEIVRLIYEWYVYGDENGIRLGGQKIAEKLTAMRVPTKADTTGKFHLKTKKGYAVWSQATVLKILRMRTYYGEHVTTSNDREFVVKIPAILDKELWEQAQHVKKNNIMSAKRNTKTEYLFRGRLTCGSCGYDIMCYTQHLARKNGGSYSYERYKCNGSSKRSSSDNKTTPCHHAVNRDVLDNSLWKRIENLLRNPESMVEAAKSRANEAENNAKFERESLERCKKELVKSKSKKDKVLDLYLEDKIDKVFLQNNITMIDTDIEGLSAEIERLEKRLKSVELVREKETEIRLFCDAISRGISAATFEEKRAIIELLDIRAVIHSDKSHKNDYALLMGDFPIQRVELDGGNFAVWENTINS